MKGGDDGRGYRHIYKMRWVPYLTLICVLVLALSLFWRMPLVMQRPYSSLPLVEGHNTHIRTWLTRVRNKPNKNKWAKGSTQGLECCGVSLANG